MMRMKKLIDVNLTMSFCTTLTVCQLPTGMHGSIKVHLYSTSTIICPKPASLDGVPAVALAPRLCLYSLSPGFLGSGLPSGVQWSAVLETVFPSF